MSSNYHYHPWNFLVDCICRDKIMMMSCFLHKLSIFAQNLIIFSNVFTMNVIFYGLKLVQWHWYLITIVNTDAWCFSTKASVATVMTMYSIFSSCFWVNYPLDVQLKCWVRAWWVAVKHCKLKSHPNGKHCKLKSRPNGKHCKLKSRPNGMTNCSRVEHGQWWKDMMH